MEREDGEIPSWCRRATGRRLERYLVAESPTADQMVELRKRVSSF